MYTIKVFDCDYHAVNIILTYDVDLERLGHHVWWRLWSIRTQSQQRLTSDLESIVSSVQSDVRGARHIYWRSD